MDLCLRVLFDVKGLKERRSTRVKTGYPTFILITTEKKKGPLESHSPVLKEEGYRGRPTDSILPIYPFYKP